MAKVPTSFFLPCFFIIIYYIVIKRWELVIGV